ncbi:phosphoribosyl-AMP cyclohydrolase [Methanobacterium spitsbergense]|uniref:Phosphoribosyl-AMP cyclohydrolase n=1 Tax=Methanobacterium spitsbergense TaxID=2874285 RepID=A0A8T5UY03_9EURY|nr:phosphoribosyl-AMP cyclohydrolase [Methanobacterium spitsbergense]MBZ2166060.1 phosphoribosyl-AMP cyclohydrolase [Methanobacterium spitsbergense]
MDEKDLNLNFRHEVGGEKLVIAIAQDYESSEVIMVAYMNKEALMKTLETKIAHYWSTSRNKLWLKGESSGHTQEVQEVLTDCDEDAVLLKVRQNGGACHEGYYSCFFRKIQDGGNLEVVKEKVFDPENIYGDK